MMKLLSYAVCTEFDIIRIYYSLCHLCVRDSQTILCQKHPIAVKQEESDIQRQFLSPKKSVT